jgi:hypothetical protein
MSNAAPSWFDRSFQRIYGSRRTRRSLVILALATIGGTALAAHNLAGLPVGPQIGWALTGIAVGLLIVAFVTRLPENECSFCTKSRLSVRFLVAGPHVAVCDECASLSMAVVAEGFEGRSDLHAWHRLYVDALPWNCPRKISRPLLEVLADGSSDAQVLREVSARCLRLHNDELACEILQRIPEGERKGGPAESRRCPGLVRSPRRGAVSKFASAGEG